MKRIAKVSFFLLIGFLLVLHPVFSGGQGDTSATREKFLVGFCPRAFVSVFFVVMAEAIEEAAEEHEDIEVQILSPIDQKDIEGQIRIVEDFTEKKVDLLAVSVNDPHACVPALLKAQEAGIPIIVLDTEIPLEGIDVLSIVGHDNIRGGKQMGEFVVELLGGKGKIVVIEGVTGQYSNTRKLEGFHSIIDQYPDIEVLASQPADWDRSKAMAVMENYIQAYPDIDLVWGLNDGMALGALKAIEDAGMLDDIIVIGYNGDEEALVSIKEGKMYATMKEQPAEQGRMVIEIAEMIKNGKIDEVDSKNIIPVAAVTAENVDEHLKQ